nr:MAG TPA: MORN repeat-containing protein 4, Myosin-IIIa BINDING, PROTEIN TRANSPORT, MOTOR [Caudoviricetes sp.]
MHSYPDVLPLNRKKLTEKFPSAQKRLDEIIQALKLKLACPADHFKNQSPVIHAITPP